MASALQPPFSCLLLFLVANITPNSNAQTGLLQRFCGVCPQRFPKVHDAPILAAATTIMTKPMIDHTSGICPKNAKPRMAVKIMLE